MAYALNSVFSARGAYLHIGAIVGTVMAANVFMIIIPGQRKVVNALIARPSLTRLWARGASSARSTTIT
jgi:uncharacterized membrane protein